MTEIQAKCFTNLNNYDCGGLRILKCKPVIGECMEVKYKGDISALKICMITHTGTGLLKIELTSRI